MKLYEFSPGPIDGGRVTIFAPPRRAPDEQGRPRGDFADRYVIGADFAYGLTDGDFDYAVVMSRTTGRQVAEAQGRWGDVRFAEILAGLYWYYGEAFIVGERQVGLPVLRRLYDEMNVRYQYFDRDDADAGRTVSQKLGHFRRTGDLVIPRLRRAIAPHDENLRRLPATVTFVSPEILRQLRAYQWRVRRAGLQLKDVHDVDLTCGGPEGDHDDGVMAAAYAVMGLNEVGRFPEPERPKYRPTAAGAMLDHDAVFAPKDEDE